MAQGWERTRKGLQARLEPGEVTLLRHLGEDLLGTLESPRDGDVAAARLFPDPVRDDPKAAADLRALIEDDVRSGKIAEARLVTESLREDGRLVLDDGAAEAWLRVLNDLRLVLGTRLGVTEEMTKHVDADAYELYRWLSWLQETLVEALSSQPN